MTKGDVCGNKALADRAVRKAQSVERDRLERSLVFLATTGSATPFIGLFGTVWGILTSFQEIGTHGSATLAVVAPGIAEALVATAVTRIAENVIRVFPMPLIS